MVAMLSFGLGFEFLFLACIGLCCVWGCGVFFCYNGRVYLLRRFVCSLYFFLFLAFSNILCCCNITFQGFKIALCV